MTNQKSKSELDKGPNDPRTQIMAAAYRLLAEKGYDAATMKEIARAAGVAPGLIHYYFDSKDQLLLEVLSEAAERYIKGMERLTTSTAAENLLEVTFSEPRQRVNQEPEWYRLRCELFALGLRNSHLRPGMTSMLAAGRRCISEVVNKIAGDEAVDSSAIAAILLACFDGLALQKLADPNFDLEGAYNVLLQMFKSQLRDR